MSRLGGIGKYIYHYHAKRQLSPGTTEEIDGIVTSENPIVNWDRYQEIKSEIGGGHRGKLTICSLSLLHGIGEGK